MRWPFVASLVVLGCGRPSPSNSAAPPTPSSSPPVAPTATATATTAHDAGMPAPDPAVAKSLLHALGQRVTAELDATYPTLDESRTDGITSLGPCTRPSPDERDALKRAIVANDPESRSAGLTFGCKDRSGIVVDVAYDRPRRDVAQKTCTSHCADGIWRVVRVSGSRATTLLEYVGTSSQDFMEWVGETIVQTIALADLDGDGDHDAVIATDSREGGSPRHHVKLSIWLSRTKRLTSVDLSEVGQVVLARGQPRVPGQPLVLGIQQPSGMEMAYRCVEPAGTLDLCPAATEASRIERVGEIAGWFAGNDSAVDHHKYGPYKDAVPDREELAQLLDVLRIAPAEQAPLLASVAPARPEVRVMRELVRLVPPVSSSWAFSAAPVPDPRPAELQQLLGDTACAPAADPKPAIGRIAAWIAANDGPALARPGVCPAGQHCTWGGRSKPTVLASCAASGHAYYSVRWTYVERGGATLELSRDGLFFVDAKAIKLVHDTIGAWDPREAVGDQPPPRLDLKLYRRGESLVALVLGPGLITVVVDGAATVVPATVGQPSWFRFGEYPGAGPEADDLIEVSTPSNLTYWHWDGAWSQLASFPPPTLEAAIPALSPAGAWLWRRLQQSDARHFLEWAKDSPKEWAHDAQLRAKTQRALTVIGADPATLARVAAAAAELR